MLEQKLIVADHYVSILATAFSCVMHQEQTLLIQICVWKKHLCSRNLEWNSIRFPTPRILPQKGQRAKIYILCFVKLLNLQEMHFFSLHTGLENCFVPIFIPLWNKMQNFCALCSQIFLHQDSSWNGNCLFNALPDYFLLLITFWAHFKKK